MSTTAAHEAAQKTGIAQALAALTEAVCERAVSDCGVSSYGPLADQIRDSIAKRLDSSVRACLGPAAGLAVLEADDGRRWVDYATTCTVGAPVGRAVVVEVLRGSAP